MIELGNIRHGVTIARATQSTFNPHAETVISRSERGELFGGTIFSNYCGTSLCMDVAGFKPNWCNRNLLWLTFTYAFKQLQCKVIVGRVWSTNKEAIKFDTHVGFREHSRIKDAVPRGDLIIMTMYKEDCKWLELKPRKLEVWDHLKKAA